MTDKRYRVLIGLDRDGTINKDPRYFGRDSNWMEQVQLLPGVVEGIQQLRRIPDVRIVVCTNQAGVARRFFDVSRVEEINRYIAMMLKCEGAKIDDWYFCPYVGKDYAVRHDIPLDSTWVQDTDLRKPGAGMIRKAASDVGMKLEDFNVVVFVGDKASDVETGLNAGGYGVLVANGENQADVDNVERMKQDLDRMGKVFVGDSFLQAASDVRLITRLNGVLR